MSKEFNDRVMSPEEYKSQKEAKRRTKHGKKKKRK
jgi:hypothetical protein